MSDHLYDAFDSELVLVGAPSPEALGKEIARLVGFLDQVPDAPLEDVAYTAALAARGQPCIVAVVTDTIADLRERLKTVAARLADGAGKVKDKSGSYYFREHLVGPGTDGKLAFLFPGATSFYPDMLRDLAILFPECRAPFDELQEALGGGRSGPFCPSSFVFPPAPCYRHDADVFGAGGYAEAMVGAYSANCALRRLFFALGVLPDGVFGFSGGDLSALALAGVLGAFPRADRVAFLRDCYKLVDTAVDRAGLPKCVMASLVSLRPGAADAVLKAFPSDKVAIAFSQSPRQQTVAIAEDAAESVLKALATAGVRALRLPVDRPFNTPWCAAILPAFRQFAQVWGRAVPRLPVYSCASAEPFPPSLKRVREETTEQWAAPIRFDETVRRMSADGYRVFLELGPRGNMCSAIDDILRGQPHVAIAANGIHRSGLLQLHHALGALAALGVPVDATYLHARRRRRKLDFDSPLSLEIRADSELRLARTFPRLALFSTDTSLAAEGGAAARAGKAAARAAAVAARARRQRQFDFGAVAPLISDADTLEQTPGISVEISKTLRIADDPFLADYALGTSQLSYSDPSLRGLTLLPLLVGAEMMAELAQKLVPTRHVVRVDDLICRRPVAFAGGHMTIFLRAERVSPPDPKLAAVKVQIRDDSPNSAYTWPVVEGTFLLSAEPPAACPIVPDALPKPRSVHWTDRDIYPDRLPYGESLRLVRKADVWSEAGLDYEVEVPPLAGPVAYTRFPIWVLNPLLLEGVISGFSLWRAHERFAGAFSMPFRLRRLALHAASFPEGARLRCYLRLTSVTPRSHLCDIHVSDGNGNLLVEFSGWEELTERVPEEYRRLILSPASTFLTKPIQADLLGSPATPVASALVADVPYPMFERNEELWLKTLSGVVLGPAERRDFAEMTGATSRRAEWLFGRIAAKEAVRRFLNDFYQARWSDADVQIWADDSGKPHALGEWSDFISSKIDLAIAHTAKLVVALVAANARVGIDVEALGRDLSDEFTRGVFTSEELELAAGAVNAPGVVLRFWCAKEAVSKALGTGIRYSPKDLVVVGFQADSGDISVQLRGQWLDAFKEFKGRDIHVASSIVQEHALASCFIPASLFPE